MSFGKPSRIGAYRLVGSPSSRDIAAWNSFTASAAEMSFIVLSFFFAIGFVYLCPSLGNDPAFCDPGMAYFLPDLSRGTGSVSGMEIAPATPKQLSDFLCLRVIYDVKPL